MLRHGDKQSTARPHRIEHLCQCSLILNEVFQDIEGSHDIKFALEQNASCIHLIQLRLRQAGSGKDEAIRKNFTAREAHFRKIFVDSGKHKTGPATNLEETLGVWKIFPERPLNEHIPSAKPEICSLNSSKPREIFGFESGPSVGRILSKLKNPVAQSRPVTTSWTCPIVAPEATFAREAPFHRSSRFSPTRMRGHPSQSVMRYRGSVQKLDERYFSHSRTIVLESILAGRDSILYHIYSWSHL